MSTDTGFQALSDALRKADSTSYGVSIPDGWRQGRTAYGGLTAGLGLAATQKAFPDLPPVRSASINFIGPVGPDPVFTPTLLRQGRNVISVQVDTHSDGNIVATNTLIFGTSRESHLDVSLSAPKTISLEAAEPFSPPKGQGMSPVFFYNFDTRLIEGERPMSGAEDGYIRVWSRHVDENSRNGTASFLTLGDVLPPAALPLFRQMGPISSINWMLNIINDPVTEDGWWHVETKLTAAKDGYSSQVMRFWNNDGLLVAEGMQAVAIFV